jgi:DNA-directed RNA polymerase specialized sigma subunit
MEPQQQCELEDQLVTLQNSKHKKVMIERCLPLLEEMQGELEEFLGIKSDLVESACTAAIELADRDDEDDNNIFSNC